jgi:hypothetical protein
MHHEQPMRIGLGLPIWRLWSLHEFEPVRYRTRLHRWIVYEWLHFFIAMPQWRRLR